MDAVKHGAIGDGAFQNEPDFGNRVGVWGHIWSDDKVACLNDSAGIVQLSKILHWGFGQ